MNKVNVAYVHSEEAFIELCDRIIQKEYDFKIHIIVWNEDIPDTLKNQLNGITIQGDVYERDIKIG